MDHIVIASNSPLSPRYTPLKALLVSKTLLPAAHIHPNYVVKVTLSHQC